MGKGKELHNTLGVINILQTLGGEHWEIQKAKQRNTCLAVMCSEEQIDTQSTELYLSQKASSETSANRN